MAEIHDSEHGVSPLELFFDLVFVFAITQVTSQLAEDTTWGGVLRGLLVLAALWWAWAAYAWLTNAVNADEGGVRLAMLAGMAAMLVVALAVPGAFGGDGILFAGAYLAVRLLHLVLFAVGGRNDRDMLAAVERLAVTAVVGPGVILAAGFVDDVETRMGLWAVALALDFLGPAILGRGRGWRLSPEHFAERHGLIVIIALGESIVALGVGARAIELDLGVVAAAGLAIVLVSALWWLYFDVANILMREHVNRRSGVEQARVARDVYSYLHFPMVAGIVLVALGLKKTFADFGDPLGTVSLVALAGGTALYLLAHVAWSLRLARRVFRRRVMGSVVLLALIPLAADVPALAALAIVGAVCCLVVVWEVLRHWEDRARVRHPELAT